MRWRGFINIVALLTAVSPVAAHAQHYPSRAVTIVVPAAAGGTST
jgi:tripartite-type tricarboxylate transporter receptor subunit TctC